MPESVGVDAFDTGFGAASFEELCDSGMGERSLIAQPEFWSVHGRVAAALPKVSIDSFPLIMSVVMGNRLL